MHGAHAFQFGGRRALLAMAGRRGRGPRGGPGRGARHGPGFGGFGPPFGGGRGFGPPFGGGRGFGPPFGGRRRMRRGDVRAALLVLLSEQPLNGYGLMQEIESRSQGVWRPSPGSVYPALSQLEDEGLVVAEEHEGRKRFRLSEAGRAHLDEHREELGEPWASLGDEVDEGRLELHSLVGQLGAAAMQVLAAGDDGQVERARKVLADARRALYRILADDGER